MSPPGRKHCTRSGTNGIPPLTFLVSWAPRAFWQKASISLLGCLPPNVIRQHREVCGVRREESVQIPQGTGIGGRRVLTASCGPKMPTPLKCDLDFPDSSRDCQTCPLPWDRVRATRRLQTPLPRSFNPIHRHSQAGSLARERCFNVGHLTAPTVVFLRRDPLAKAPLLSLVSGAAWTLLKEGDLLRCPLRGPSNRAPQRFQRGFPWPAP